MAVTKTGATKLTVYNPKFIYITPFSGNVKGSTTYSVEDIIRDSTTITQDDAEENAVENELKAEPIINNITAGSFTFATNVGDLQKDLLKALVGYAIGTTDTNIAYAPSGYTEVFVEIAMVFETGGKYVALIMPKVQLNSKVTIESMSTSVGYIAINGTGYSMEVTESDSRTKHTTPFYIDADYTLPDAE